MSPTDRAGAGLAGALLGALALCWALLTPAPSTVLVALSGAVLIGGLVALLDALNW
jgi:hypothetical protein